MKIVFEDSELNKSIINVSLDGGFTFNDYEITDVKETGISLDDSQDYEKIKIKGPANVLKCLDIITKLKLENETSGGTIQVGQPFYVWGNHYGETCLTFTRDLKIGDLVLTLMLGNEYNGEKSALQFDEIIGIRSYDDNGEIFGIDVRGVEWSLQSSNQIELFRPIDKYGNYLGT